jgi:hypothetical protein
MLVFRYENCKNRSYLNIFIGPLPEACFDILFLFWYVEANGKRGKPSLRRYCLMSSAVLSRLFPKTLKASESLTWEKREKEVK